MTTLQRETTGTFALGGDLTINRLGYGAMRITGDGIWGEPKDRDEARKVLQRAVELGVNFIDTADSYGVLRSAKTLLLRPFTPIRRIWSLRRRAVSPARVLTSGRRLAGRNICGNASK